jgi:hypothetical protein
MDETMTIPVKCRSCGREFTLTVRKAGYEEWRAGTLIQRALPELSADQRELLISGICGTCFDAMFRDDDGDEGDGY